MICKEVLKKIKEIELTTKRLLRGSQTGDYQTPIKGSGFEFDQICDYQIGDDVRTIDWKSSARMDTLLVKQYIQERNRVVIIAVDISASTFFTSSGLPKSEVMAEIASILSLVADHGKDAVSLLLFSDEVELFIPFGRGIHHVRLIMEMVFTHCARSKKTSLTAVCDRLLAMSNTDGIVFLVSDFIDELSICAKKLLLVAKKFDTIAVRCLDRNEHELPAVGFLTVVDSETECESTFDVRGRSCAAVSLALNNRIDEQNRLFKKSGIELLDIVIEKPFIGELVRFFRRRVRC